MHEQQILEGAMRRGLELAARGPAADTNPRVGCVILGPDGEIVAEGWHEGAGTPHAEVAALAKLPQTAQDHSAELTAVVTLEPCNHTGRTGPCALALIEAGIGHVVFALADPGNDEGGGAERLRAAGVEVVGGVLEDEARAFLADWLAARAPHQPHQPLQLPRVIAKWAQSLDGRAAAADGSSQWITGPEARADVHQRRQSAGAILVGTGTVLADDPSLTARGADGELLSGAQPIPVVLGHRAVPAGARVNAHPAGPPILLAGDDLRADLALLASRGVTSVFIEGGPTVTSALIAAGLVDELLVYVAPMLIGGPRTALGDIGVPGIADAPRLVIEQTTTLGADILFHARFDREESDVHGTD